MLLMKLRKIWPSKEDQTAYVMQKRRYVSSSPIFFSLITDMHIVHNFGRDISAPPIKLHKISTGKFKFHKSLENISFIAPEILLKF